MEIPREEVKLWVLGSGEQFEPVSNWALGGTMPSTLPPVKSYFKFSPNSISNPRTAETLARPGDMDAL